MKQEDGAKWMEERLSRLGASIADATDLLRQAKALADQSESMLINAQKEIEALYISLEGDVLWETSEPREI